MNNNLKTFLNYFILITLFIYFVFLLFRLLMSRPILDPLVVTGFLSIFYIFLEIFKVFLISLIFVKEKFFKSKNNTFVTFFQNVKLYFETDFLQDFLDNKIFFNKFFILIFKMFAFLSEKIKISPKKITFGVVYLPWIIFLMVFLKEIFIQENIKLSLYFFFFCFFIKRIFSLIAWIGLFKSIQLKKFVFVRDFPAFCNSCQEFFSKNLMFKKDLFFFQPTLQEKNLLLFIWNAYIEIDFCFRVQSYIYGYSKIYFDFAEKFIKIFNIWFFSIIFVFLLTENQINIILRKLFLLGFFCYLLYFCYFHFFYQKAVEHDQFLF